MSNAVFNTTTQTWDVSDVNASKVDPEVKKLFVALYMGLNRFSTSLGARESGTYPLVESMNGQKWFANPDLNSTTTTNPTQRQGFRKVIIIGSLPDHASTLQVAHGINCTIATRFTRIYGSGNAIIAGVFSLGMPLPYVSARFPATDMIELWVDDTYVNIAVVKNYAYVNNVEVVLEWIQS